MKEEQNITIRIANQPAVSMTINRNDEEIIRRAEKGVNQLWEAWCRRFDNKTPVEVLAMVAFQFARYYYNAEAANDLATALLENFEKELDTLLGQTAAGEDSGKQGI